MAEKLRAPELIKVDKNGSKHYVGEMWCDRCGGQGGADAWKFTGWTCYKCGGTGKVVGKWIERTPEHEAKLAKARAKRLEKATAEYEAKRAEIELAAKLEAERKAAEEARIRAQKAVSQYVGEVGQKYETDACYEYSAHYEVHIVSWDTETRYVHVFKDVNGNKLVWKTSSGKACDLNKGEPVHIKAIVKEHCEYDGEKQTMLLRAKIERIKG